MLLNFFTKLPIPNKIPDAMQKIAEELSRCVDKEDCLKRAHQIMTRKFRGYRFRTCTKIHLAFETDLKKLWSRDGFLHCHTMNYLLRVLLVKSGWFDDLDIQFGYSLVWYVSPHQYLRVRIGENKYINMDVWNHHYGKKFGDYAHGFH